MTAALLERVRKTAPPAAGASRCPVCGGADVDALLPRRTVPLYCNVLWDDQEEARRAPRGAMELMFCRACAHIYNRAYDADLLAYAPGYDNSLHFSGHFSAYAEALAADLVREHDLHGKFVVDVGCGRGDFLGLLCRLGANRGRGFDPSFPAEARNILARPGIEFVADYFSSSRPIEKIDILCCRQVLEHIGDPAAFLRDLGASPGVTADTILFFEVPNSAYTLQDGGIWDIIYEHCSYFSASSLVELFERCGFDVLARKELYSSQYLGLEARLSGAARREEPAALAAVEAAAGFAAEFNAKVVLWQRLLRRWKDAGERAVVWGAGSKGVSFLDILRPDTIDFVVDVNPRKEGRYLPGSGAEVVAPAFLQDFPPDRVILMNPVYREEVSSILTDLGVSASIVPA